MTIFLVLLIGRDISSVTLFAISIGLKRETFYCMFSSKNTIVVESLHVRGRLEMKLATHERVVYCTAHGFFL